MPELTMIAAVADNGVIGHRDGRMPWSLPADLARFRRVTWGHTLVMGRRTFEAIGRPLPGRRTVVVSRNPNWPAPPGVERAGSLSQALAATATGAEGEGEVFIAGGGEIYALAMAHAGRLRLTHVHLDAAGEVTFPEVDWRTWRETWREAHPAADGRPAFTFADYVRV